MPFDRFKYLPLLPGGDIKRQPKRLRRISVGRKSSAQFPQHRRQRRLTDLPAAHASLVSAIEQLKPALMELKVG